MEIRVWNETGDLIGYCTVKESSEPGYYDLDVYPNGTHERTATSLSESLAIYTARELAKKWKADAEQEIAREHGIKPEDAGISIQEVE